jgi:hypothetical protein
VVACGQGDDAAGMVDELKDTLPVVLEPVLGPTSKAFSGSGYPTFYVLDERGRIAASAATVHGVASAGAR